MRKVSVIALAVMLSSAGLWYVQNRLPTNRTERAAIAITGDVVINSSGLGAEAALLKGTLAVEGDLHLRRLPDGTVALEGYLNARRPFSNGPNTR
jgi:hypothetical protein